MALRDWFTSSTIDERSIRPGAGMPGDDTPNTNPPPATPPSVAVPDYTPGSEGAIELDIGPPGTPWPRSSLHASPWDGWPANWSLPGLAGDGRVENLIDTAWIALDLNAAVYASMPPYLVGASPNLSADWIVNPSPDHYNAWSDFAHALMWDYQCGEAFVVCTARYATGWPARFHVAPPWTVDVDFVDGRRTYRIGGLDVTDDILHIRYRSTVDDARGHGPLEVGRARLVAAGVLLRYLSNFVDGGAVPSGVLETEDELTARQAADLADQWVTARMNRLGLPAVLDAGVTWKPTQVDPLSSALAELAAYTEAKIAVSLGVPPFLLGLPSGGDSMTYSNVASVYDYHWRGGLRPKASRIMGALSGWLVPRGTVIEVNRDEYVRPGPYERAQTAEIWMRTGVLDRDEVRESERFGVASTLADDPSQGVDK